MGLCLLAALAVGAVAGQARADNVDEATRAAARDLGYEGVELFQKADYVAASDRLDRAYRALRIPSLGLWSARALGKLGKLIEASERYLEVARLDVSGETEVQQQAKADAARERDELQCKIPRLVVKVAPSESAPSSEGVRVTIDGAPVPDSLLGMKRPVNPGHHVVVAQRGGARAEREVTVTEGATEEVLLSFVGPAPSLVGAGASRPSVEMDADPGRRRRTLGWVVGGVGGAGLVLGGVTGALAMSKKSSISDQCRDTKCLPPAHDDVDSYNVLRTVSTIGFVAGVVGVGAGLALVLTAPKREAGGPSVSLFVDFSRSGVQGAF